MMLDNKVREIIISGYGSGKGDLVSIGLYELTNQLKVNQELWTDKVIAPSFLCTYHDICFAIREESESSAVLCYQRQGNEYVKKDELTLEGGALCHIVYEPKGQVLYCAFYETGHVAAVKLNDYYFSKVLNFFQIKPSIEKGLTRAHCCVLEPDGTRVFVANIALDRIYIYDTKEGVLEANSSREYVQLEEGIGPRHIKFHPILNYLYLITEYSNEIYVFLYENDCEAPKLTLLQKISTLPKEFQGVSYGSALDISKDGRFLYGANRGADTIGVYDISPTGLLTKLQDADCGGNYPRHIALTKDDRGLMIANQKSNEIVILAVDENKGTLLETTERIEFYQPSYVAEI